MACAAARKAVREALLTRTGMSAQEVWEVVGWWTPTTIAEALEQELDRGLIRVRDYDGRRHYFAFRKPVPILEQG